jgi:Zn-dependent peptidase ImmA (M78 family)/transcriptional regulator with XRE-family HTH domain
MAVIASNLHRLRKQRAMSQDALAERAGLSRAGYRAIEKGTAMPRADTMRALSSALHVPLRELVTPVKTLRKVRFRSLKRLKRRDDVLAEVGRWLSDYASLEDLLDDHVENALSPLVKKAARLRDSGMPAVASAARAHFGLSPKEPVHDICGLLTAQSVKVMSLSIESDAFFGLSVADEEGGPAVVVNTWSRIPVETWIFSAAHELGHLLLHLASYVVDETDENDEQEKAANGFASHFLMPEAAFKKEWDDANGLAFYDRVLKVKRIFRVSWRTVLYRVGEALSVDERKKLWQRFSNDHERRTQNRLLKHDEPAGIEASVYALQRAGAEPAKLDAVDFLDDRLSRLVRSAVESGKISLARGAEILRCSNGEMRQLAASWD